MAIGNVLGNMLLAGGKGAWNAATSVGNYWSKSSLGKRLAVGAGIGAIGGAGYGAISGGDLTAEARIKNIIRGLSSGVALGLAAPAIPSLLRNAGFAAAKAPWDLARTGWTLGRTMLKYPGYTLGAATVGIGAYGMYTTGVPIVEQVGQAHQVARAQVSYSQNAAQYEEMQQLGVVSSPVSNAHSNLMNSTQGLVQGLSRSRHG